MLEKDGTDIGTDRQTDGRTPDRYITLSARRGQSSNGETVGTAYNRYRYTNYSVDLTFS